MSLKTTEIVIALDTIRDIAQGKEPYADTPAKRLEVISDLITELFKEM